MRSTIHWSPESLSWFCVQPVKAQNCEREAGCQRGSERVRVDLHGALGQLKAIISD